MYDLSMLYEPLRSRNIDSVLYSDSKKTFIGRQAFSQIRILTHNWQPSFRYFSRWPLPPFYVHGFRERSYLLFPVKRRSSGNKSTVVRSKRKNYSRKRKYPITRSRLSVRCRTLSKKQKTIVCTNNFTKAFPFLFERKGKRKRNRKRKKRENEYISVLTSKRHE